MTAFTPNTLTVSPGDTIVWAMSEKNMAPHTVTFLNGAPEPPLLTPTSRTIAASDATAKQLPIRESISPSRPRRWRWPVMGLRSRHVKGNRRMGLGWGRRPGQDRMAAQATIGTPIGHRLLLVIRHELLVAWTAERAALQASLDSMFQGDTYCGVVPVDRSKW